MGKVNNGKDYLDVAKLRNVSDSAPRGIRGIKVNASNFGSRSLNSGLPFNAYWLSYRRSAPGPGLDGKNKYGLCVLLGSSAFSTSFSPALDDALLDMTPHTSKIYDSHKDAYLMPGFTYSDYDSDVHITTVSQGGVYPMEYLDVVVNVGTVEAGNAAAPIFDLEVSNKFPSVGEFVSITARLPGQNIHDYGFSWYTNEIPEAQEQYLNQPSITKSFNEKGEYVIRLVVSDLKGGLASSNLMIKVGDYQNSELSSISGTVRSKHGMLQGARVVAAKAPITEHFVNGYGAETDLFLPSGFGEPLKYSVNSKIGGNSVNSKIGGNLEMRRGGGTSFLSRAIG